MEHSQLVLWHARSHYQTFLVSHRWCITGLVFANFLTLLPCLQMGIDPNTGCVAVGGHRTPRAAHQIHGEPCLLHQQSLSVPCTNGLFEVCAPACSGHPGGGDNWSVAGVPSLSVLQILVPAGVLISHTSLVSSVVCLSSALCVWGGLPSAGQPGLEGQGPLCIKRYAHGCVCSRAALPAARSRVALWDASPLFRSGFSCPVPMCHRPQCSKRWASSCNCSSWNAFLGCAGGHSGFPESPTPF